MAGPFMAIRSGSAAINWVETGAHTAAKASQRANAKFRKVQVGEGKWRFTVEMATLKSLKIVADRVESYHQLLEAQGSNGGDCAVAEKSKRK